VREWTDEPTSQAERLRDSADDIGRALVKLGLLIGKGGFYGNVLRIAPPLTVTGDEIDQAGETIAAMIGEID
jgi:4-aminobutyrate aminotransferase-like enzyme